MTGVVLCGGQSTRMGTDKGLLKLHANTWAQTAIDKLATLSIPVILSVNANQYESYSAIFSPDQLVKDNDSLLLKGPLCGVLSVHLQHPSADIIILACDMPLLEPPLLKCLLNYYREQPDPDAFVYSNNGEPEPLCGIYKARALEYIIQLYRNGHLPRHSMKYVLDHIHTIFIPLKEEEKKSFRNFNAHAELNGL